MRIESPRLESDHDIVRATATVIWEDCDRPTRDVYFETEPQFADLVLANPNAWAAGCFLPARWHGEKRLKVEGRLCPALHAGLGAVMRQMSLWYGGSEAQPVFEPTGGFAAPQPTNPPCAASFLSGGIDSMATLRQNRMTFPQDHPASIRRCLCVYGFDLGGLEELGHHRPVYDRLITHLQRVADDAGCDLVPVSTNVRHLYEDVEFWTRQFYGAALAAVAHVFSQSMTDIHIASGSYQQCLFPTGSHPLLDHHLSSGDLRVHHDMAAPSRLAKMELIARWPVGFANLRVCWNRSIPEGQINCGTCSKCIHTKLLLMALDKLSDAASMPGDPVEPEAMKYIAIDHPELHIRLLNVATLLRSRGHEALAAAVEDRCNQYEREQEKSRGVQGRLRQLLGLSTKLGTPSR